MELKILQSQHLDLQVCGYAPRLRLDLSVNILTNHAITNNKITVFGGKQLRPNLDIETMLMLIYY